MSTSFPAIFESIQDLNLSQIKGILTLAQKLKNKSQLDHIAPHFGFKTPVVATLFMEPSTRTKTSFAIAAQKLGAFYIDFDLKTSSLQKGEDLKETLLNLSAQGVNLAIIRTPISGGLQFLKNNPPMKVINGGDGENQHPTQALLDLFTMEEMLCPLEGKTMAIIGDSRHSRVAHSLIELLPQFGLKLILCGPKPFLPEKSILKQKNIQLTHNLDEAIKNADLLYLLRIQKERHISQDPSLFNNYPQQYGVTLKKLEQMNCLKPIFHPGPANIGVEIGQDLISSPLYKGYKQVENSIYVRQAIIKTLLEKAELRKLNAHEN